MSLAIYFVGVAVVVSVMLSSYFLGERGHNSVRDTPYESGILATGTARVRFFSHYFLIAILFVVFDVESVFFYIWSVSVRELGTVGLLEVIFFVAMLILVLLYVISMGILNFAPTKTRTKEVVP